jgi:hypothetical protein
MDHHLLMRRTFFVAFHQTVAMKPSPSRSRTVEQLAVVWQTRNGLKVQILFAPVISTGRGRRLKGYNRAKFIAEQRNQPTMRASCGLRARNGRAWYVRLSSAASVNLMLLRRRSANGSNLKTS